MILLQHLPDRDARHGIEAGRRLVEEEDARLVHEAARDLDAAPHAARQVLHLRVAPLRELDRLEQLVDQLLRFARGTPYSFAKMIRFSSTLSSRSLVIACGMTPIDAAHAVGLLGDVEAVDDAPCRAVGGSSVVSMRMSVDLPAPLGPSRPKISPCSTRS